MSVDQATVRRVARLARIAVTDGEAARLESELNGILAWVEQLGAVDIADIEPMTSVVAQDMKKREDRITEGDDAAAILANAPASEDGYFVVPKVVE